MSDQIFEIFESIQLVVSCLLIFFPTFLWSCLKFFIPVRSKNISGQLALITGGSEGIGRGIAFRLAKEGCNIAIANRNLEKGRKTAEEIRRKYNVDAKAFQCDVGNREDVRKLKAEINESLGVVDILVNNAGILTLENSLLEGDDDEYYQYCVDVNLTSWIWTTRTFLPDMINKKRGHIVGISSRLVQCPFYNTVTYATTKYGNQGFMDGLREEMCFYGFDDFIKISTVFPGHTYTMDRFTEICKTYFLEPMLLYNDVEYTADVTVNGLLKNYENIYISIFGFLLCSLVHILPRTLKTRIGKKLLRNSKRDEYINMRLKHCNLFQS